MFAWLISFVNSLIKGAGNGLVWCIALLPSSPFSTPAGAPSSVNLGWITWFIDFPTMIAHFSILLSILLGYYLVRIVARWLKVVRE